VNGRLREAAAAILVASILLLVVLGVLALAALLWAV
jgi:hypothetical protein